MDESQSSRKYSPAIWDEIRANFQSSIMVDTKLTSLAQNVGVDDWPVEGDEETPNKYVHLTYAELQMLPEIAADMSRIDLLVDILQETLAFDDPFGDMVEQVEAASKKEDNILKSMAKLNIPRDYPLEYTALSAETKQFCKAEDLKTIGQFVDFSQNMAQNIVVGGDFRTFLNALASVDEKGMARYLPFRPGSTGFHLPEAIGNTVDALEDDQKLELFKKYGGHLSEAEEANRVKYSREEVLVLESNLQNKMKELFKWFEKDKQELEDRVNQGMTLERYFMVLDDPKKELIAAHTLDIALKGGDPSAASSGGGGLFKSISKFFKK